MATSYDKCYESFLGHIDDNSLLYPMNGETDEAFQIRLNNYLLILFKSAVPKFKHSITSLNRDDTTLQFTNDLRDEEIEIIGLLMVKEYYRKYLNFLASLKDDFSDKDWKSHDKANKMNQYRQMMKEIEDEIDILIVDNSLTANDGSEDSWLNDIES